MFHYQQKFALEKPFDVTFVVDNRKFPAHRSMLSAQSNYFKRMFSSPSLNAKYDSVILQETNVEAFDVLLFFIYTGSVSYSWNKSYTTDEKFEILTCARNYRVYGLVEEMIRLIKKDINSPNMLLNKALAYNEDELIHYSTKMILSPDFYSLLFLETHLNDLEPVAVVHLLKQLLTWNHDRKKYEDLLNWVINDTICSYLFPELLKHKDLNTLEMKDVTELLKSANKSHQGSIRQRLLADKVMNTKNGHLYLNEELSDVTLVIDGTELPAHRSILSERSEYFKIMFSSSFIEANSDKIILKEVNLNAFKAVLKYIYTGLMPTSKNKDLFTLDKNLEILACAQYCMMDDLAKETTLFIICNFDCTSLQLLKYGFKYFVDDLITYGTESFLEDVTRYKETDFNELPPVAVEHLLKQPLNLMQTQILYEAVINWTQSNPKYSCLFPNLLKLIDLSSFDVKNVAKLLESADLGDCQRKMRTVKALNDKYGHLYLNEELSDVTLVIDGTELSAHLSILSERSEYFKAFFSKNTTEATSNKITLKETTLRAFKAVLQYVYTGSMFNSENKILFTLDKTFEVLTCARHCMLDDLAKETMLTIICIFRCTPVRLLNYGLEHSIDVFIEYSTDRFKERKFKTPKTKFFERMSPLSVKHVLKFCTDMQEYFIFEELEVWIRANPEHFNLFPEILNHVKSLNFLKTERLTLLFESTHLIE